MLIGIVGKPSSGKTTILNALCLTDAKMGDYPFTTIKPNRGVAYAQVKCHCSDLEGDCQPRTGKCENGIRFVPIEILDVAGLVPGASEGKGMGNQFLDDLRQADAFIHVVDTSGLFDAEGIPTTNYDPSDDVTWLNSELTTWVSNILFKDWDKLSRKLDAERTKTVESMADRLSGLGATIPIVKSAMMKSNLLEKSPRFWEENEKLEFADIIRKLMFPSVIAANKADKKTALKNIENLIKNFPDETIVNTSGLAELVLRNADKGGKIKYIPGSKEFEILVDTTKPDKSISVVLAIKENIFDKGNTTGVSKLLEICVFDILKLIAVFPVEDSTHLTDHDGRILPDVYLVPEGTTAKEFAGKVHTDLQKTFINGLLVNDNNKRIAAAHIMKNRDIIKIVAAQK